MVRVEFDGNVAEALRAAIARLGRARRQVLLLNLVASYRDPLEIENPPIRQLCRRSRPGSTGLPPHREEQADDRRLPPCATCRPRSARRPWFDQARLLDRDHQFGTPADRHQQTARAVFDTPRARQLCRFISLRALHEIQMPALLLPDVVDAAALGAAGRTGEPAAPGEAARNPTRSSPPSTLR